MQAKKITLIEIGAGALPIITPAPQRLSSWFPIVYVSPDVPPVEGVVPNPVADGVLIEWGAVDQEGVIYIIERGPTAQGPWTEIARVVETRYLYSDGSGQEWWFKITASVRGKPGEGALVPVKPPPTAQEIIDLIEEQNQLGQEMAEGFANQAAQIANLEAALAAAAYDPATAYSPGAVVKWEGGLYYALVETLGNEPSDTTFWQKIGDYSTLAEAVGAQALQLSGHEIRIEQTEESLGVVSERVDGVVVGLGGKADSTALNALSSRVDENEEGISANAEAIQTANSAIAGKASSASVAALTNTVTEQGGKIDANAQALTSVRSSIGGQINLLSDTALLSNWAIVWDSASIGATLARNRYGFAYPYGDSNLSINVPAYSPAGAYVQVRNSRMVPVVVGETYWVQLMYAVADGLTFWLGLDWLDSAGNVVSEGGWDLAGPRSDWPTYAIQIVVPSGVAGVRFWVRTRTTYVTASERLAWFARPMISRGAAGQTSAPPYSGGSAGIDEKFSQVTQSIEARTTVNENGIAEYRASWTMSLDANGRVAGIRSVNNGATSTIDFLFDRVRFVSPGTGRRMEYSDGHFLGYDENNVRRIRLGTWSN